MKTTAAVIDFGTSKIVTVLAESGAFSRCEIRGSGTVPYAGYSRGSWNEPIELAGQIKQSIAAAELEAKSQIKEAFVSVPADFIRVKLADAEVSVASAEGRVSEDDMDAVQDAAAESLGLGAMNACVIHRSPAWFSVDGGKKTMTPIQSGVKRGKSLRALTSFLLADSSFVSEITELFSSLHITLRGFVAAALGEAVLYIPTEERDKTAALIDVGYLNTEISVVEGDAIVFHKVLPVGGGFMTADFVENLELDMTNAEKLKREYSFDRDEQIALQEYIAVQDGRTLHLPVNYVGNAMARTMNELLGGIQDALKEAGSALGSHAKVYLTGGGLAPMRGAIQWLSNQLDYVVKPVQANSAKLNGYCFASVLGEMDQIFDTLEPRSAQEDSFPGKLVNSMKNLLRKEDKEDTENDN